jgi:hypothetical protein
MLNNVDVLNVINVDVVPVNVNLNVTLAIIK